MKVCLNSEGRSFAWTAFVSYLLARRGLAASAVIAFASLMIQTGLSQSAVDARLAGRSQVSASHALAVTYAKQPLRFEQNAGQDATGSRYFANGRGYTVRLEQDKATLELSQPRGAVRGQLKQQEGPTASRRLALRLVGANGAGEMVAEEKQKSTSSYFGGSGGFDTRGKVGLANFGRVRYAGVLPGVDLSYYGRDSRLEYDLDLMPGADARRVEMLVEGADEARLDKDGNLVLKIAQREVRLLKPVAYQPGEAGQPRRAVEARYQLTRLPKARGAKVGFAIGAYDRSRRLVIDPVLEYATYLDNTGEYAAVAMTADLAGNAYVVTEATSTKALTVLKFDPNGNLLASATLSGDQGVYNTTTPTAVAVSSTGSVYVTGLSGTGLPTTANAYQAAGLNTASRTPVNAFLAVFGVSTGSAQAFTLNYCSYLGAVSNPNENYYYNNSEDAGLALAVDAAGAAYVAGFSTYEQSSNPFPTTPGAYQAAYLGADTTSAFVAKLDPSKSGAASLVYSTLLGGDEAAGLAIAVDGSGNAYVTGSGFDAGGQVTSGALTYSGIGVGPYSYVTKLNPTGTAVVYSAELGPGAGTGIAVDGSGDAYVTGTIAAVDFPTTAGAYQTSYPSGFAAELNPAGSALAYSTFLGGPSGAANYGSVTPVKMALAPGCASKCAAYISGQTSEADFPAINPIQSYNDAGTVGFLMELAAGGGSATYSTYLSGQSGGETAASFGYLDVYPTTTPALALDAGANVYVVGNTFTGNRDANGASVTGSDFPVTPLPVEPDTPGGTYLAKIGPATAGNVVATPASVAFSYGVVNLASSASPIELRNVGSASVTISSIVASPASEFSETNTCNGVIAGGAECTLNVVFTPEATGARSGTISILTSDSTTPVTITVSGMGYDQGYIQFSPATLAFADQVVGTVSAGQVLTLTNVSHTPATSAIQGLTSSFVTSSNCPSMLDPGNSCQLSVQFAPSSTGLAKGSIYSAGGQSTTTTVSGTGILAGTGGNGSTVLSSTMLNLGSTLVGTTIDPQNQGNQPQVYLSNTGSIPVGLQSITVALTSSAGNVNDFSFSPCGGQAIPFPIAAVTQCGIYLSFTPSVAATETATITFTDSSGSSPHVLTVSGTGFAATQTLEFTPGNQVFVDQPVGFPSAVQTFNVYVSGTAAVTVDRVLATGDFHVTYDLCSGRTLQPPSPPGVITASGCQVNVTFTPTAIGARTGTLTLTDSATGNPQVLNLIGNGIAATGTLVVNPVSFTFPAQAVGTTTATQEVDLNNEGNSTITVNSITTTGDFAAGNINCPGTPFTLSPSQGCGINVAFTPTATSNPRTGTLTVGASSGNQMVSLTGSGETATQAIAFTPSTTLSFGSIPIGTTSYTSTVYVRNTGTEPVTFSGPPAITTNYSVYSDGCTGQTLAGGASCGIILTFTPSGTGVETGTLTLTDSAGTGTQTLALTGTGIAATSVVDINAPGQAFDELPVTNGSSSAYYYLYNYGTSEVISIASASITAGSANFSLGTDYCSGNSVQPGGYCTIYVNFNPTAAGYLTGTLTFKDTSGVTYAAALSGYSEPAANSAVLTPASENFGDVVVGNSTVVSNSYLVTLTNTGTEPLAIGTLTGSDFGTGKEFTTNNDGCSGQQLSGHASCQVYLQFTPSSAGNKTGTLVFPVTYAGATAAVNFTANLSGTGIADKASAVLTPSVVTFTDQVVGTTSSTQGTLVYLQNTGNLPLTVGNVTGSNFGAALEFALGAYDGCSGTQVSVGSSCPVSVQFTPSASGNRTGTVVFPVTYSGASTAINLTATLSGKGIAPVNSTAVSATNLNFGPIALKTTSGDSVMLLTNFGNQTVTVQNVTGTNYGGTGEFVTDSDVCSGVLLTPGASCRVYVNFTPQTAGTRNGTVIFPLLYSGSATPVSYTATLTGVGAVGSSGATLSPNPLDLGSALIGTTVPTSYSGGVNGTVITNTSSLSLTVGTITGTNFGATSEFWLLNGTDSCSGQTIAPQASCYVQLTFTPSAAGTQTGTLVVPVNYGGSTSAVNLTEQLTGFGLAANTTLAFSQNTVPFGSQAVGTSSAQNELFLMNYGSAAAPVTSITLAGTNASDFTESDTCAGTTVAGSGGSCGVFVTFTPGPTSLGARTATVTEKDPATGSPRVLTLTGTGVADTAAITFYPATLAFSASETIHEGTAGKVVGLNYAGTQPLTVTSVTSSDPTNFPVVQDGCSGATVASGAACQITVAFAPATVGTHSATISVVDSGTGSPQKFTVTGGGVAAVATTAAIVATPSTGAAGSLFTLVATVKDSTGAAVKNGSVAFYYGAGSGTKTLGTAQVVTTASGGGTVGTATWKTRFLPIGANSITAKYIGGDTASTSAATTVTVTGKYPSTEVLTSSGVQGSYALVATVAGQGPVTPTGTVVFNDAQATSALGSATLDPASLKQALTALPAVSTGTGSFPQAVAIGDVNGDGIPDLVTGYGNSPYVLSVLLGNGDGTYKAAQPIAGLFGSAATSIVLGDFNGDGKLDIAIADVFIGVFLGNGDGTFQGEVDYDTSGVQSIALADLNGDGILDIVAGNATSGTMDLLLGNGDGSFQDPVSTYVGGAGYGATVGDFNGDGKPDVLLTGPNTNGYSLVVLLGNGNGTFQAAKSSATVNYGSYRLAVADLNGDGKLDVVSNDNATAIGVLLGNGDGTFGAEQTLNLQNRGYGQQVIGDVNGDGKPDILLADDASNSLDVLLGNGDGTFQSPVSYPTGIYPAAAAVADLNGDGQLDVVVVNQGGGQTDGTVSVFLNQITETATLTGVTLPGVKADSVTAVYSGDANYVGATSNALLLPSNAPGTAITLAVTPTSGAQGTVFTLKATVVDGTGAPVTAGVVNFLDGGKLLGSSELVAATGIATYETRSLSIGSHALTATFTGTNLNKLASTLSAVSITVTGKYATTTALSAAGVQGTYALTATVDGFGLGSPSGSVSFKDTTANTTLGTVPLTAGSIASTFIASSTVTGGTTNNAIATGDFNGDGKPDLAVVDYGTNMVSIYLSNGDGTVKTPATYAVGTSPGGIAAVDLNGDGKLDLAVTNGGSSNISILIGNGDGTFQTQKTYASNGAPSWVDAGDLNGDGKTDLVVTNYSSGTVSVFLGNGDGTLQSQVSYPVGSTPYVSYVHDVNGDGKPDIVVANSGSNTVGILLGNGDGTFKPQQTFAAGTRPLWVAIGDFNNDGKVDLAVANGNDSTVGVLLGNGDGTFNAQTAYAVGTNPYSVAVGDANGDGKLDLLTANGASNNISVLFGNGDGTFGTQQAYGVGTYPEQAVFTDLNGDGRLDIVSVNADSNNLSILLGVATEGVSLTNVTLPGSNTDNVVATYSGDTTFNSSTSNTLTLPSHALTTTTTLAVSPASGALGSLFTLTGTSSDSNGKAVTSGSFEFFDGSQSLGTSQASAGSATLTTRSLEPGSNSITVKYLGTDSYSPSTSSAKTITVTGKYATTTSIASTGSVGNYNLTATVQSYAPLLPTGAVSFTDTTSSLQLGTIALGSANSGFSLNAVAGTGSTDGGAPLLADFNRDGRLDSATCSANNVALFLGNGDGTFLAQQSVSVGIACRFLAIGDMNGDGIPDLVVTDNSTQLSVSLGNGDGTFKTPVTYTIQTAPGALKVADFNGDGRLDVVVLESSVNMVGTLLGNGDGTLQGLRSFATGSSPDAVTVADFNGDGRADLGVSNSGDGTVTVLLGNGDGTFGSGHAFTAISQPFDVTSGDFNHDGKPDLAVASFFGGGDSVLLGNGDGTFQTAVGYPFENDAQSIVAADINGDGNIDLISSGNGQVYLQLGKGDGTFQPVQPYANPQGGYDNYDVAVGDLNNDLRPDLVVSSYFSNASGNAQLGYLVFLNQGVETATLSAVNIAGTGTHNVTATYAGDTNFTSSTSPAIQLGASQATATVTLTPSPSANPSYYPGSSIGVAVTSAAGINTPTGSVSYTINGGTATVAQLSTGGTVTLTLGLLNPGTYTIKVTYSGDSIHATATATTTLVITKSNQTINFAPIANTTYGAGAFGVAPTANPSGLPVSIKVVSGPAMITAAGGIQVTGAGTVTIEADQAGNVDYNAAAPVQQSFNVATAPLSVVVNNATRVYGTANPVFTSTITGLIGTDAATAAYSTTATQSSPFGSYPITATVTGTGIATNYTVTVTPGTLSVTKTVLTVTAASASRVYGAANPSFTGTIAGLVGADTAVATYSTTATAASGVGSYPISATVTGNNLGNYTLVVVPGALTVTQAALQLTVNNASRSYGAANPTLAGVFSGLLNGDAVAASYSTSAVPTSSAGSYPITATVSGSAAANYLVTVVPGTLTVSTATLTVAVNSFSRVYGSALPTYTGTVTGLLNGDTVSTSYSSTAQVFSYVGTYPITATVTGAAATNYTVQVTPGTLTVTQAILKVTANAATRIYGAANPVFTGSVTGILNGDAVVVTYSSAANAATGVGQYANIVATLSGPAAVNYDLQLTPGTLTITPAPLSVTVNSASRVYGSANPVFTGTVFGLLNGDTLTTSYSTTATSASVVGTYPITATVSGALLANYTLTTTAGTLTITKAVLTETASNASRLYGAVNPALTYAASGFVNGDTSTVVSGTATLTTTAIATSPVGSYPITFATEGLAATNYSFNYVSGALSVATGTQTITFGPLASATYGVSPLTLAATSTSGLPVSYTVTGPATISGSTLTINGAGTVTVTAAQAGNANVAAASTVIQSFTVAKAVLMATAASLSRPFNQANPALTYAVSGFVNGDPATVVSGTATLATTAVLSSPRATYPITFATEALAATNYSFTYVPGVLTVSGGSSQTITFATLNSQTYGASPSALTATASSGLPVAYTVTGPATISGSTLTITGAGLVTVTASQAGDADYAAATSVSQSFTVAKATLTATAAAATRFYGQANPTFTYAVTGFVNGDTSAVVSGNTALSTTATATSTPGSYPITFSVQALEAANYNVVYAGASLTVQGGAPQTVTFAPLPGLTYGASPITPGATASSGLPVAYSITGPATVSGSTLIITGAGTVTVTAAQPGNTDYAAATSVTQSFSVAKAALTVTANNISRQYNVANPSLTYAVAGFVNGDARAVVGGTATLATTATTASSVSTYPITFSTEGLTATNYSFTYLPGTLTVTGGVAQTITFAPFSGTTYGAAPFTLAATATSGLPVTYTVSGPATLSGSTLTITGAGVVGVTASQAGNTGYAVATPVSQSFTVAKAALTVTANNLSRQYNIANPTLTYAVSGFVDGDTSAVVSGAATLTTTATATSQPGNYPVTFATETLAAANYSFTYVSGSLTVSGGASQTITFGALAGRTYGAAPIALSATATSGLPVTYTVTGPAMLSGSTLTITGTGTVAVTAQQLGNSAYAAATPVTQSFTVASTVLTVTATSTSRSFGLANPALTYTLSGFVNGDTGAVVSGAATLSTTATSTSAVGSTYPITFSSEGLAAANYSFTYVPGVLTISSAGTQTITFAPLASQVYGASPLTLSATASSGLSVSYTVTGPATVSGSTLTILGSGTITVTASQPGNANISAAAPVSQGFAVSKAVLTVTANNASRLYNTANPAFAYTVSGFVNGDSAAVVSGTSTLTTTATTTSSVGSYPITFATEGLTSSNYTFNYVSGTLTVGTGTQTISFGPLPGVTYGASPITLAATASSGLAVTYTVTGPATLSGSTLTITGAGTVTVTASQPGNANFPAATPVSQSFTVSKAVLQATANSVSRQFNTANPSLTYSVTGFVNGDASTVVGGSATLSTTAITTSSVGSYPITFATEALTAANYSFTYIPGTLTVSGGAVQTITFGNLSSKVYGASPIALSATANSGLPVTYTVTGPATVSGSTLTITGAGSVTVTASQAGNASYAAAVPVAQTFAIAKASLTVTAANVIRQFNTVNPAFTYSVAGFVNGDSASVLGGTAVLTTTATAASVVGTYPITFATEALAASNYTFTYVPGVLTVSGGAAQTITFGALSSKVYGASPIALSATATSGLPVSFTVTGPATLSGSSLTITGAGTVTVTAAQAGNSTYAAATPVPQTFTVSKAGLTVTAVSVTRQFNAANPSLTYSTTGFVNGDTSAVVGGSATLSTTAVLASAVGSYPITFSTEALTASNYSFTYVPGTLTVSGGASQTITFGALSNKIYGNAAVALSATASSGLPVTYTVAGPATLSGSTLTITGAGSVTVTASQTGNATYAAGAPVAQTFTVAKAGLTLTAASVSRQFNTANPSLTYSVAGFVNGDTASVLAGSATLSTTATTSSSVGTYPITFATEALTAANYSFTYVAGVLTVTAVPTTAAPTFSLAAGTYTAAQTLSLSDASAGAVIYYTTDGTNPTLQSTRYTTSIAITMSETVKAFAILNNVSSAVSSVVYVFNAAPVCTVIDYSKGFPATGLALNGSAKVVNGTLQLTDGNQFEAGSGYFATRLPATGFVTDVTFQMLNPNADGMTFVIQGVGPKALGSSGGGLGYAGILQSAAIKFDLHQNAQEGSNSTGTYLDGAYPSSPSIDLTSSGIDLHSGHVFHLKAVYNGNTINITLTDTLTLKSFTTVVPGSIPVVVGSNTAYFGFTGGTGGNTATAEVLTWSFSGGTGCGVTP